MVHVPVSRQGAVASADVSYRFIAPATERYIITLDTDLMVPSTWLKTRGHR